MRILHTVEFYNPSKGGAQEVVRQLSERMVELGHDVTVATSKDPNRTSKTINGVKIIEFNISGNQVVGMTGEVKKYKQFLQDSQFDIMMNYAAQQWATDLAFKVLNDLAYKKVLVPCGYSALYNPDFSDYFAKLPDILKKYSASIYLTKHYQDYVFARKHKVRNLQVIPNGADEREFNMPVNPTMFREKFQIKDFFILAVSNHTNAKGHRETLEAFKKLSFPATLVIIGGQQKDGCYDACNKTAQLINKNAPDKQVLLLHLDRAATVEAFKSADVFLFLSNIEASPLVLFEAAAAGLPFVSSNVGNAKEIARWTKAGFISKTTHDTVHEGNVHADINSVVSLLEKMQNNRKLRNKLAKKGRENWAKRFTWEKITQQYLKLYKEVLS